jgi:hypothetical protein
MRIVCNKCGATGSSKCPVCRTVFPDDEKVTYLQEVLTVEIGRYNKEWRSQVGTDLIITSTLREGCADPYDGMIHFLKRIRDLTPEQLKQLCCNHHWEHTENCSFCGFKIPEESV